MSNPRRDFLGWIGATALVGAAPTMLTAQPATRSISNTTERHSADWDMSWVDRVKGQHKAVFDAPEISEGLPLARASLWSKQYTEVYGTKPTDMSAVLVLRHNGIALAMDDDFWSRFKVAESAGMKRADGTFHMVNPSRKAWPEVPLPWRNFNMEQFQSDGGIALGCNLAFMLAVVPKYQEALKVSAEEAQRVAKSHLLPGVTLMPSGFFAVSRAQEAGCQFIPAS
jgi:hypothetical protein